ncbi:hypothetical protein, variant 1 [Aphanomyces invadans]|uniref:TIP41-like protein n=1 Tax=Aphanomyces invadans TaxID=157072 RepID=A0A024UVF5_9STRA|nr:hypothetical protein, variant 1 [Aphanomyces invadans]ETW10506.1 hypothetical protein, variant 1 [Aphanomyces invadans]|eukprot:XP_008861917.1 hypothetical protein, variant 1 [Aphanomyces invadans]
MADTTAAVPDEVVGAHGSKRCFRHRGWIFESFKTVALGTEERTQLSEQCEVPCIPLPEIVYGDNYLRLTHEASGWAVTFNAKDALMSWARHQRQDLHSTLTSYDVMYTCEYEGSPAETFNIEPTEHDIPLDKLREHATILFYDHICLFEDDIRDLGEVELIVKIRVMPFGFLVLCRYFARMDDKMIKLRDSRYYHEFGTDVVLRDFEIRESTTTALHHLCSATHEHEATGTDDAHPACFIPTADLMYANTAPITRTAHKIHVRPTNGAEPTVIVDQRPI